MEQSQSMQEHCSSAEELIDYLKEKGSLHNHYKAYSSLCRAKAVARNKCIYLNTGKDWNDIPDRKEFNPSEQTLLRFGKCFSYSREENIAMWMLYGGIDKRGGMIDFTRKGMRSILSVQSVETGYFEDSGIFRPLKRLNVGEFEIYCIDVVYCTKMGSGYFVKRGEECVTQLPAEVFNGLGGCRKAYPWQYENECRLIVSIDRALLSENSTDVRIDLSGLDMGASYSRIYRSPNYPDSMDIQGTKESSLQGDVDWDLCKKCKLRKKDEQ